MKKLPICIIFTLLLLIIPFMTAGIAAPQKTQNAPLIGDWTILIGLITKPRNSYINGYRCVEFNAIFLHYRTHWFGNIRAGFFHHFERIVLPAFHYGYLGSHVALARFTQGLAPY